MALVAETELLPLLVVAYETPTLKSLDKLVSLHVGGTSGAMVTVVLSVAGVVPDAPLAVALTENVPAAVGVP